VSGSGFSWTDADAGSGTEDCSRIRGASSIKDLESPSVFVDVSAYYNNDNLEDTAGGVGRSRSDVRRTMNRTVHRMDSS
jgi:hypothetical protein